ncbi:MAG TPA: SMC-Scp complex subunit ScpB [Gemmatimonadota bacterium]|jgi:segregation and condensation protein B|nr:SMC-Scp complex subunit ScpB [Gemmatimonadota bacterium]
MNDFTASPKQILEALLFAADEPLSARRIAGMIDEAAPGSVAELVRDLNADYLRENRAFHVQEIAGGYRLVTRPEFATWIAELRASDSSPRLSQAALETLSIVAYKQPVTRAELESIRGVTVEGVLKTLVDRELVRITGREEGMGRPLLYGTTDHFLEYFGLPSLDALPRPDELEILFADRERQEELALEEAPAAPGPGDDGEEE